MQSSPVVFVFCGRGHATSKSSGFWMSFRMVFEFWYLGHAEKRSLAKSRVAMGEALRTGPHEIRLLKVHGT